MSSDHIAGAIQGENAIENASKPAHLANPCGTAGNAAVHSGRKHPVRSSKTPVSAGISEAGSVQPGASAPHRGGVKPPPWTPAEDALFRKLYVKNFARLRAELPHRSLRSLRCRAVRLRIPRKGRTWTPVEDALLVREWGELAPRTFRQKLPGRAWSAILRRGEELNLGPLAQDKVSLSKAAETAGYALPQFRRILAAEGVAIYRDHAGARAESRPVRNLVDPVEARDAVERHLARSLTTETLGEAARRHDVYPHLLRDRLRRIGVSVESPRGRGFPLALDPAAVDRAMGCVVTVGRPAWGGLKPACKAAGVSYFQALAVLRGRGLGLGRGVAHPPEVVREIVAELVAIKAERAPRPGAALGGAGDAAARRVAPGRRSDAAQGRG